MSSFRASPSCGQMWLTLANHFFHEEQLDWRRICQFAFNDRVNPDDHKLSVTIVKVCTAAFYCLSRDNCTRKGCTQ